MALAQGGGRRGDTAALSPYRDGDSMIIPNDVQLFKATKSVADLKTGV
jgi:hypothetical protein